MRNISQFVVTKTKKTLAGIIAEAKDIGFLYPAPHIYIERENHHDKGSRLVARRLRPLCEKCATVRDSRLNSIGVGIVFFDYDNEGLTEKIKGKIAFEIKKMTEDLCIQSNYGVVSCQEKNPEYVDTMYIPAAISKIEPIFKKRI